MNREDSHRNGDIIFIRNNASSMISPTRDPENSPGKASKPFQINSLGPSPRYDLEVQGSLNSFPASQVAMSLSPRWLKWVSSVHHR